MYIFVPFSSFKFSKIYLILNLSGINRQNIIYVIFGKIMKTIKNVLNQKQILF